MKKLFILLITQYLVLSTCFAQYDYILNTRTGKFDAVRSAANIQSIAGNPSFNGNRTVTRSGLPANAEPAITVDRTISCALFFKFFIQINL